MVLSQPRSTTAAKAIIATIKMVMYRVKVILELNAIGYSGFVSTYIGRFSMT